MAWILLAWLFAAPAMAVTVTSSPVTCTDDTSIGTIAWASPGNASALDGAYASFTGRNSEISHYLKCTSYNFAIPTTAVIDGITVNVADFSGKTMYDYAVQLVKGGAIQATNYATMSNMRGRNPSYKTYGSATDLWGGAWYPADINSANFGVVFAAQRGPYNTNDTAYVDHIQVTIDYTIVAAPTVTTNAATGVTDALATLNGTVNDNGADTTVSFDYGTTVSYGTNVAATPATVTGGSGNTAVSAALTGLSCNTTYHFRVNGTNTSGTNNGLDQTFTTSACPAPPTANTGSATSVASTSATLNGTINDNGGDTTVSFDYGTTTGYGTNVAGTPATVTKGSGVTSVSAALSGLSCNTTYHFRVNGTNSAGTTNGIDNVFTTGACSTTATGSVTASPTQCVSDSSNGSTQTAWTGLTSVGAQDGAVATSTMNAGSFSPYLVCTGYGFNLPSGSTVNGISVDYWIASDSNRFVSEQSAQLVKANVVQGSNLSSGASIPTGNTQVTYGGTTNLWGSTWTAADINNTGFGAAFAAVNNSGRRTHYAYVDYMPITVYYTYPLTPPTVTSINRAGSDPVGSGSNVSWTVVFDQGVAGVDVSDFALAPSSGISGASITSVTETSGTGTNTTWTVTANTGSGAGTLGLNLVDNDSIMVPASGLPLGGTGNGNGDFTGQLYTVMNSCVGGAFGATLDTSLWTVTAISGPYTPQIIDAGGGDYRLRLTDTGGNEATFAQIKNPFPAYGNKVVLTFDYFSYGGSGADGMAVTFSDATVTSTTGGFGGSLGYAQNTTAGAAGFGGGWMGIGLDEYGNYPCTNEGRTGYPTGWTDPVLGAVTPCTGSGGGNHYVAVRGSGSGTTGYNLIANTGLIAATAPATGAAGDSPYRYRVTLDHSDSVHAYVTVERDTTGTGNNYTTLIPQFDIKGASTQATVPANWLISFTGSTGGATNNHELKQVEVCANTVAGTTLDHLEIEHASGTGVTCTPSTLTIRACADASCSTPYTLGVTGTVSVSGTPTVNWSGGTTFSIPAGFSTVTKDVQVTTPGNVTFSATASSPATSAYFCNFGSPSCTFTASDSGFLVGAPDHVSESTASLTVQAVKKADNSLACVPAFANATKTVNFTCAYSDPGSGTLPVRVGGSALNATNSTAAACDATGANVSLSFDASGVATPSLQYADVGQMNVTATYTGTAGTETGLSMTGTGSFKVAPASFAFSSITGGPIKAGNNFGATITAQNSAGNATPNFGKESTPEGVTLTSTLVSPAGGANPAVGNNTIAGGSFSNGVATANNLYWPQVGNITLTAALASASYLGSGLTASGTSATVGTFIPDHFDTTVSQVSGVPMACPGSLTCPTLYNGIVYSGQPFNVNVYAQYATAGGTTGTTTNYDGTLGFSKQVTLTAWDAIGSTTTQNPGGGTLSNNTVPAASFRSGTTTLGTPATPSYAFGTVPTAPTDIYMRAADADATSLRSPASSSSEEGVKVVSGRIDIANAHGSELLNLPIAVAVQYWDGTSYVTSSTDSVTSFATATDLTFSNCLPLSTSSTWPSTCPPPTSASPASVVFASGTGSFTLSPPGTSNVGSVDMNISVPGYLSSNTARATFGVYSGSKNLIYMQEQY